MKVLGVGINRYNLIFQLIFFWVVLKMENSLSINKRPFSNGPPPIYESWGLGTIVSWSACEIKNKRIRVGWPKHVFSFVVPTCDEESKVFWYSCLPTRYETVVKIINLCKKFKIKLKYMGEINSCFIIFSMEKHNWGVYKEEKIFTKNKEV